jgi:hypothetical protein
MLLITKRRKIGTVCGHTIYAITKSEMIPIPHPSVRTRLAYSKDENRSLVNFRRYIRAVVFRTCQLYFNVMNYIFLLAFIISCSETFLLDNYYYTRVDVLHFSFSLRSLYYIFVHLFSLFSAYAQCGLLQVNPPVFLWYSLICIVYSILVYSR